MKKYVFTLLLVATLLLNLGCDEKESFRYIRDYKTGLCYSVVESFKSTRRIFSTTNVPCTPEVLQAIRDAR